jgi:hypothetical protein
MLNHKKKNLIQYNINYLSFNKVNNVIFYYKNQMSLN